METRNRKFRLIPLLPEILIIFTALSLGPTAFAMDLKGTPWSEEGCSKGIEGKWELRSHSPNAWKALQIGKNAIHAMEDRQVLYSYSLEHPLDSQSDGYLVATLKTADSESRTRYIKVRPHLVYPDWSRRDYGGKEPQCLIKLFRFGSLKDSLQNKYINWDIYQRYP